MIKILIAENMQILRDCLKLAIESKEELEVMTCSSNFLEVIEMIGLFEPDLILLGLSVEEFQDNVIKEIKKINSGIKIIILTEEESEESMNLTLQKGVDGYFLKNIKFEDLYILLKNALNNNFFDFDDKELNSENIKDKEYKDELQKIEELKITFTPREQQVLELVVKGMTNDEIATKLKISIGRARNIVTELMNKCMAKNRTQLAVMSINASLVKDV